MQLIRSALGTIIIRIFSVLLGMSVSVLLARKLSPDGYGVYAYALSIMSLLAIPVQLGIPTLVLREVAKYHQLENWGLLRGILVRANQMVLVLSISVSLTASAIALAFLERFGTSETNTFFWTMLLLPVLGLGFLREATLQGLRRIIFGQIPEAIISPVVFIVLLLGSLQFGTLSSSTAMSLYFFSAVVALIVGSIFLAKSLPKELLAARSQYNIRPWLTSLIPLSLLGGLHIINSQIDIFMLGTLSSKDAVGHYRVAFSGAALVLFFMTAIGSVFAPNIARLHSKGDFAKIQRMVTQGAQASIAAAVPIAFVMIVFGQRIITFVYGKSYSEASIPLAILCCGQLINAFTGFVHITLNMMGYERETLKGVVFSLVLNILLNLALIPSYGATGAAISAAASIATVNIFLFIRLYKITGISSLPIRLLVKAV